MWLLEDGIDSIVVNKYKTTLYTKEVLFEKIIFTFYTKAGDQELEEYFARDSGNYNYFGKREQTKITKLTGKCWKILYS